jgi:hypothetical protein
VADWAKISAGALGLVKSTNKSLLEILRTDNQLLEAIQVDFWSMIRELRENGRRLEITCFFEELPLPVVGKVVSKDSYYAHPADSACLLTLYYAIMQYKFFKTWSAQGLPIDGSKIYIYTMTSVTTDQRRVCYTLPLDSIPET